MILAVFWVGASCMTLVLAPTKRGRGGGLLSGAFVFCALMRAKAAYNESDAVQYLLSPIGGYRHHEVDDFLYFSREAGVLHYRSFNFQS